MMPEESRDCAFDPDEEFPWDPDLFAAGESDVADMLDDGDD